MQLDKRISVGCRVWVSGRYESEVVAISEDRLTCQVRAIAPAMLPSVGSAGGFSEISTPPVIVHWHEVKLVDHHL